MSRAPTAIRPAEPVVPEWFRANINPPLQQIVLVTCEPATDVRGIPARWHERRAYKHGRWVRTAAWADPLNLQPLDPQPTHWRPDPARQLLEVQPT